MAIGSGLSAQLGVAAESAYNTYSAPATFFDFVSEKIAPNVKQIYGKGLRTSRLPRKSRARTYVQGGAGSIEFELLTTGFGKILKAMLGSVATTQPDAALKPLEYLHTFTPDVNGLAGQSTTVQVGRPTVAGTVVPFTYTGGKITDWQLSAGIGDVVKLGTTWDFGGEDLTQPLAVASYPADMTELTFIDGSVTLDGVTLFVSNASVSGKNGLKQDRYGYGNTKREPLAHDVLDITGQVDCEWEALANHQKVVNGTIGALELKYAFGAIDAGQGNPFMLKVSLPFIKFEGDTPTVDGPDILKHPLKFKALADDAGSYITMEYHTTDITP